MKNLAYNIFLKICVCSFICTDTSFLCYLLIVYDLGFETELQIYCWSRVLFCFIRFADLLTLLITKMNVKLSERLLILD